MNNPNIPIGHSLKCLSSPTAVTVTTPHHTHSLVVTLSPSTSTPHSLPLLPSTCCLYFPPPLYTPLHPLLYSTLLLLQITPTINLFHPISPNLTLSHPTITPYNTLPSLHSPPNPPPPPPPSPHPPTPYPFPFPFFPSFPLSLLLLPRPVEFNLGKFKNLQRSVHTNTPKKRYLPILLLTTKIWCPPQAHHTYPFSLSFYPGSPANSTTTQTFFFYFRFPLPSSPLRTL